MTFTLTDILAIIAIVVSIISFIYSNHMSKQIANKTLKKEYFDTIFLEFMLKDFPDGIVNRLENIKKSIRDSSIDAEKEIDALEIQAMQCVEKAKPYKYINNDLYLEFYSLMIEVDDLVVETIELYLSEKLDDERYNDITYKLDILGKRIYDMMKDEYMC